MSKELFKKAREINSLNDQNKNLEQAILKEKQRIQSIQDRREKKQQLKEDLENNLKDLKQKMQSLENDISHLQQNIEQDQKNIKQVIDNKQLESLENSIKHHQNQMAQKEDLGLEILDEIELMQKDIQDANSFIEGSKETLEEIRKEVNEENHQKEEKIKKNQYRMDLVFNEMPDIFADKVKRTIAKNLAHSSFSRIIEQKCEHCKIKQNSILIDNVETKLQLHHCPGCSRLFLPEQSFY